MPPTHEEHMITITLSPAVLAHHRIKGQLKLTYNFIKEAYLPGAGKGVVEMTKQGNIHYHIKTQSHISDIHIFLDKLKGAKTSINGKKVFAFGFTKIDQTKDVIYIDNYEYLEKDIDKTTLVLKKLGILDRYHVIWKYEPKKQRFNEDCIPSVKRCIGCLDKIIDFDNISDTEKAIEEMVQCV